MTDETVPRSSPGVRRSQGRGHDLQISNEASRDVDGAEVGPVAEPEHRRSQIHPEGREQHMNVVERRVGHVTDKEDEI